jgi:hypothetical protein
VEERETIEKIKKIYINWETEGNIAIWEMIY